MKLLHCLCWLLTTAGLLAQQDQPSFRIGTWNLEFLGAAPTFRRDTPPRTDDDLASIGKKVVELGLAVLAVQEINGEAPLLQVAHAAGADWRVLLGTSGRWDDGKTAQSVGFVYDDHQVELLQAEELLTLPRDVGGVPIFHRVPVTACFRHRASGCDFRLVTVHLKAGRQAMDEQKRHHEATLLQQWLATLRQGRHEDADIFVLGDFNSGYDTEPTRLLVADRAFVDGRGTAPQASILHFDETIDHILIGSACQEADESSFTVHSVSGEAERQRWRKTYSDHFPVTMTLRASRDDDPDSTFASGPVDERLPVTLRVTSTPVAAAAPAVATRPASRWPPKLGSLLRVQTETGTLEGTLQNAVPEGPGGWLVIEVRGECIAVPMLQVRSVVVR